MIVIGLFSCQENKPTRKNTTTQKVKTDSTSNEKIINNIYTKIADSLCSPLQISDLKYTTKNTKIISLNPSDSLDCFIFLSEVACGYPSGSCGYDMQVIMKKNGKYTSELSTCGYIFNTLHEQNEGISSFIYGTHDGYKIQVNWNGKEFEEINISVNNIDYKYISKIAEASHRSPTDFVNYDPKTSDDELRIPVSSEEIPIGIKKIGKLFTVMTGKNPELYLFDNSTTPQLILITRGNLIIKPVASLKDFYDLIITYDGNNIDEPKFWQYDKSKKKYLPT